MRTGQRDQVGFEEFVVARGAALQRAAWLLTGDEHLAQDLVQTALADAWMRWPRVARHGGDVEVYVRRCLYTTQGAVMSAFGAEVTSVTGVL